MCGFISALRAEGFATDAALAAVRELVSSPVTPDGGLSLLPPAREALAELTSHWCAEEYGIAQPEMRTAAGRASEPPAADINQPSR